MSDPFFLVAATLLGAVIGSYLNVLIYRLPLRGQQTFGSRSACPGCKQQIPWTLNFPVFSWIWLRGRARCCGVRISVRYPVVEASTALLFLLLALSPPAGMPLLVGALTSEALLLYALHAFFLANLLANTGIDLDHRILPDVLTKSLMLVGVLGAVMLPSLVGSFASMPQRAPESTASLLFSLWGLIVGFAITWMVRFLAKLAFGREAMGYGDVKLMGGIGAFLGWDGALLTFFLGCLCGAIGGSIQKQISKDPYVAFGPYLALAAVITLFFKGPILSFLTVTWPQWQQQNAASPWVLGGVGILSFVFLFILLRRGRAH